MKLGVICALTAEARTIYPFRIDAGEQVNLDERAILAVSGMGRERASLTARKLLKSNVTALLSWGTAAALAPRIKQGTLILPMATISASGNTLLSDSAWHGAVSQILRGSQNTDEGNLAEANGVLSTAQQKSILMHATGAIAADMESAAIGEVAELNGLPFLVLRCVSDSSDMSIPGSLLAAIDEAGHMPTSKVISQVLLRPSVWPTVARLARGMRKSTLALEQAGRELGAGFSCPHL